MLKFDQKKLKIKKKKKKKKHFMLRRIQYYR